MANDPKTQPKPPKIPLSLIHPLPGTNYPHKPDKTYGGLVASIQVGGLKEPIILRQREDGQYQLVVGNRRLKAAQLAGLKEIDAHVYEMPLDKAVAFYHRAIGAMPIGIPIPGKLVTPNEPTKDGKAQGEAKTAATTGDKPKETADPNAATQDKKANEPAKDAKAQGEEKAAAGDKPKVATDPKAATQDKKADEPTKDAKAQDEAKAAAGDKPKETTEPKAPTQDKKANEPAKDAKAQDEAKAAAGDKSKAATDPKAPTEGQKPAEPAKDEKAQDEAKAATGDKPKETTDPKAPAQDKKANEPAKDAKAQGEAKAAAGDKPKAATDPKAPAQEKKAAEPVTPKAVTGPAAKGPTGTAISQVLDARLDPPDEKALKDLPTPKEGESIFITLHPAYLEKSVYNTFSVDKESDNFKELMKSVELVGIKDPVLARPKEGGGLEILSGQRRHLAAIALNYPVPTIIQKIDDADAKIIVADGNLHRDKLSTYDLSRALRMKMEGMKQKAGRRKKGSIPAEELNSDEKLAKEMGMTVSKLNRMIRLSEANKDVCDRVDDGSLALSIASAISFLKPKAQEEILRLSDVGYKITNERVERMKKAQASGKLNEQTMRDILDDKDLAPKRPAPAQAPSAPPAGSPPPAPPMPSTAPPSTTAPVQQPQGGTPVSGTMPQGTSSPAGAAIPPSEVGPSVGGPGNVIPISPDVKPWQVPTAGATAPAAPAEEKDDITKGPQERPEITKVILTGDRLRKYFPDVNMTPREIEESVYEALEERRQRQIKDKTKSASAILHPAHKR